MTINEVAAICTVWGLFIGVIVGRWLRTMEAARLWERGKKLGLIEETEVLQGVMLLIRNQGDAK